MEQLKELAEKLSNPSRIVRYRAIYSLSKINDPQAIDLLASTLQNDDDTELRAMAAKMLPKFVQPEAVPPLLNALRTDRHAQVRRAAAESLGMLEMVTDAIENALIAALYDRSKYVRQAAVQSLRMLDSPSAVAGLIGVMLGDSDGYIRWEATKALDEIALETEALNAFIEALTADDNSYVRYAAAVAIGNYAYAPQSIDPLVDALLNDDNSYVRYAAAKSLGVLVAQTGDAELVRRMLPGLNDDNTHVWHAIAESLWEMGDVPLQVIMEALIDPTPSLRRAALKAMLWLSVEFDGEFAEIYIDPDVSIWGWWN